MEKKVEVVREGKVMWEAREPAIWGKSSDGGTAYAKAMCRLVMRAK